MEALLLTLDVVCMALLCFGVSKVSRTGNPRDLGPLGYSERRVRKAGGVEKVAEEPHA